MALGLRVVRFENHKRTTFVDGRRIDTKVFAEFESPPLDDGGDRARQRRHYLHTYAKSKAGAWRHAIRWLKQLRKGRL